MLALLFTLRQFVHVLRQAWRDPAFRTLAAITVVLLALGSYVYHEIEGWSWLDSLYFCLVTLATVGYGDFTPSTTIGKLFTMVYLLLGIGVLVAVFTRLARAVVDDRASHEGRPRRVRPRHRPRKRDRPAGPAPSEQAPPDR